MNTLCKVFEGDTTLAHPAPWLALSGSTATAHRPDGHGAPGELAVLRARLEEMTLTIEQNTREAFENGVRAGGDAARQSLRAEVTTAAANMARAAAELADARTEIVRRAEADTVHLAIGIARRVLHRELSVDASAIEALIKSALEKLRNQEICRVRVHPDQAQLVLQCLDQTGRGNVIDVTSDPVMLPGGVCFELSRGTLDASVSTQLQEIEHGLIDALESRP
jgi:flagellar assembly protein FliH